LIFLLHGGPGVGKTFTAGRWCSSWKALSLMRDQNALPTC
jgi:predicted kinase